MQDREILRNHSRLKETKETTTKYSVSLGWILDQNGEKMTLLGQLGKLRWKNVLILIFFHLEDDRVAIKESTMWGKDPL